MKHRLNSAVPIPLDTPFYLSAVASEYFDTQVDVVYTLQELQDAVDKDGERLDFEDAAPVVLALNVNHTLLFMEGEWYRLPSAG